MMRLALCAVVALSLAAPPETQLAGTVLTTSDMIDPHLVTRPAPVDGRDWLALHVSERGSTLEAAEVRWIGTAEFQDSIFTLSVRPGEPVLLVADVPQVVAGPATTLSRFDERLSRGAPLDFALAANSYRLALGGTDPQMCDATVTLSRGAIAQELYFPEDEFVSCDDPHFSIQWAGDLDGDGLLDLVATFSPKYSYHPRRLFLSSAAPEGALVGLVATFEAFAA